MAKKNLGDLGRVLLIYALVLLFAVALIAKVVMLQVVDGEKYDKMARQFEIKVDSAVEAKRGNIYDKNGVPLAVSIPRYEIYYDYTNVSDEMFEQNIGALSDSLATAFKVNKKSYYEKLLRNAQEKKNKKSVLVIKGLDYEQCKRLKGFPIFNKGNIIDVHSVMYRDLPYEELAKRTIGYVREKDDVVNAKEGLEGKYDSYLRGTKGTQVSRRLNGNIFIPIESPLNVAPVDGCDVYTSIDVELQEIAEDALRRGLELNKAKEGCAVLMDVETGFIEAIANLEYDPAKQQYYETDNYAIRGFEEPGSTFKAIVMTALLENNPNLNLQRVMDIGTTTIKTLHGKRVVDSHVIKNGKPTIEEGFWESSNIVFAMLVDEAFGDNPQKFIDYINKTKINEHLNLDIIGAQNKPLIKLPAPGNGLMIDLMSKAYGYAVQMSPMSLLTYYNAIANDGKMLKPQFVKEIRRGDEVVESYAPVVINERIGSEKTVKALQGLVRGVVKEGNGKTLFSKCAIPVAGKTGTAHQAMGKDGYNNQHYVATFVGYFPYDKPKYSCVVMVSNPDPKNHYGITVAAPIFKEIVDRIYVTRMGIEEVKEDYQANCDKYTKASMAYYKDIADYSALTGLNISGEVFGSDWVKVGKSKNGDIVVENVVPDAEIVPDFKGMNVTDAVYLIESMGWKAEFSGRGLVESQSVKMGTKLAKGKTIVLKLNT